MIKSQIGGSIEKKSSPFTMCVAITWYPLSRNIFTNKAGKYSPSKLNIMIGHVLAIIWFIILVVHYVCAIINFNDTTIHTVILTLLPVAFLVILVTALYNSWAKSNAIGES